MFKAMGMRDKDSELAAMTFTILLMLVMMSAIAKAGGGAGTQGAAAAGEGVTTAASEMDLTLQETVMQTTNDAAEAPLGGVPGAVDNTMGDVLHTVGENLKKQLSGMSELTKDPVAFLNLIKALGLVTTGTNTQALIDTLKQLIPTLDMTEQDLDSDSKDFFNGYTDLNNLFADFVKDANKVTTDLAYTG